MTLDTKYYKKVNQHKIVQKRTTKAMTLYYS